MKLKSPGIYLRICIALIFLSNLCSFKLAAQLPTASLFNTASNSTGTGTLPYHANDLNWTASQTSSVGPYSAAKVITQQSSWANSPYPNANWVSIDHHCGESCELHDCIGNSVTEYYRLKFNLPSQYGGQAISTSSVFCLDLDFMADNCVSKIFVNGSIQFTTTVSPVSQGQYSGYNLSNKTAVSLCDNWVAGSNTVIVQIVSDIPYSGFFAQVNHTLNPCVGKGPYNTGMLIANACNSVSVGSATISTPAWGTAPYSYSWAPMVGTTSVAIGLPIGTYSCWVKGTGMAGTCIYTMNIKELNSPTVEVKENIVCMTDAVDLSASGGNTYTWSTGQQGANITVNNLANGIHVYTVNAGNIGCSGTKSATISVKALKCVGIEENKEEYLGLQIYPNPGCSVVSILSPVTGEMFLTNLAGELLEHSLFQANVAFKEDLSDREPGIYFLRFTTSELSFTKKILISK